MLLRPYGALDSESQRASPARSRGDPRNPIRVVMGFKKNYESLLEKSKKFTFSETSRKDLGVALRPEEGLRGGQEDKLVYNPFSTILRETSSSAFYYLKKKHRLVCGPKNASTHGY